MVFLFDQGRIEVDGWSGSWIRVYGKDGQLVENLELSGEAQLPFQNFIDAILGKAEARTSPTNGIHQSELMDAVYASAESGSIIRGSD
jgi:predicted dehydrogenase